MVVTLPSQKSPHEKKMNKIVLTWGNVILQITIITLYPVDCLLIGIWGFWKVLAHSQGVRKLLWQTSEFRFKAVIFPQEEEIFPLEILGASQIPWRDLAYHTSKGLPLREERSPEEELSYITRYLKLNIPPQEAVQMLQRRDDEEPVRGICLPSAVGTVIVERWLWADIYCPSIGTSLVFSLKWTLY